MFNVKILSSIDSLLEDNFSYVSFLSDDGWVGIKDNHEDFQFKLSPCNILLQKEKESVVLLSGYGFVSVKNGAVLICGVPVGFDKEEFELKCSRLESYGDSCLQFLG